MLVCHCHAVSDRVIRETVAAGAADETEVGERCGAGTSCGGCRPEVQRLCAMSARLEELARAS